MTQQDAPEPAAKVEEHADPTPAESEARLNALISGFVLTEPEQDIAALGWMIDASDVLGRQDGLDAALQAGERILNQELTPAQRALMHYFLSNAWEAKRVLTRSGWALYDWEQPEFEREIIHLRTALLSTEDVEPIRLCQIHTNLGNLLSHCGRVIDAVRAWDRALAIDPAFAMARGNRGYGLMHYGQLVYSWHQVLFFRAARADLSAALEAGYEAVHEDARTSFAEALASLEAAVPEHVLRHPPHEHSFSEELGPEEVDYRRWCLSRRLFLNDLNDLGEDPTAATDVVTLPGVVTPIEASAIHILGFFNQLKQEYVSARFMYYEGITSQEAHYSDRNVTLVNTWDYPSYGLALERVKAAFRISYSVFDKIAFFLNDYLALGIPETRVSFRSLWYDRQDRSRGLRADIAGPDNAPLRGLFWIAKDLFEKEPGFVDAIEPEARELASVRNHLEHKYLKLHLFGAPRRPEDGEHGEYDALAYSVDRVEFEDKTLRLLQLSRAAILHLGMAVHVEEQRRARGKDESRVYTAELDEYRDEWKV